MQALSGKFSVAEPEPFSAGKGSVAGGWQRGAGTLARGASAVGRGEGRRTWREGDHPRLL